MGELTSTGTSTTEKSSTENSLCFESVSVELGGRLILEEIAFSVSPGEIVGLVGRNGAGKTTLLRLAGGILRPKRGRVLLAGDVVRELPRRRLAQRVALVPQNMHVPFPFRVGELVLMGRAPHQSLIGLESEHDVELAQAALGRLGILWLADRSITTLSGGERQLVLFARALVQDPDLLLLDEPTAFLDLKHRVEVLREVRSFTDSGRAALIVSHDLSLAARCCDRVVLLGEGRIVAQGRPAEVLTSANLREAFEIETQIFSGPDGQLVVVPELSPI